MRKEIVVNRYKLKRRSALVLILIFIFFQKNDTEDGPYEIYSGEGDASKFTIIKSWNNLEYLDFWKSPYCNKINGSDGAQFPPGIEKDTRLYIFNPDICR